MKRKPNILAAFLILALLLTACGAICTTAVGAGTALKDRQQVLDFTANPTSL